MCVGLIGPGYEYWSISLYMCEIALYILTYILDAGGVFCTITPTSS